MNQTESRSKAEGSGVGILGDSEARCFNLERRLRLNEPRLKLPVYIAAPDAPGLGACDRSGNRRARPPALFSPAKNMRGPR